MNKLPDKPSDLIELALADLAKVEAQPENFRVDMGVWAFQAPAAARCAVCFAGAVIVGTLDEHPTPDHEICPIDFDLDTQGKLAALNNFRLGLVGAGFGFMGLPRTECFDRQLPHYNRGSGLFHGNMQKLANDLRDAGL